MHGCSTIVGLGMVVGLLACTRATTTPEDGAARSEAGPQSTVADRAGAEGGSTPELDAPSETTQVSTSEPKDGPTLADALGSRPGPGKPAEGEFEAWDRDDPAADKALYQWDATHFQLLDERTSDLQCFRHRIIAVGQVHLAGNSSDDEWFQAKREHLLSMDRWQQQLFAEDPRIIEKSKYLSYLLEAHELVSFGYPKAYAEGGGEPLRKVEAQWVFVLGKMREYAAARRGSVRELSAEQCRSRGARPGRGS
ncbi:MAG: hypothetical protein AB1Z98_39420 [Nannocystaceae bacterium]